MRDYALAPITGIADAFTMHPEQIRIFKAMSPARKLELVGQFNVAARRLKRAALKGQHPEWSEQQVEAKVRDIFLHASS